MESLLIQEEGKERTFFIESRVVTLGRSGKNDIVLKDRNASRQHCNIIQVGESWFVVDCESHNGTFINGERVKKKELQEEDKISIGAVDIVFMQKNKRDDTPSIEAPENPKASEKPESMQEADVLEKTDPPSTPTPVQVEKEEREEVEEIEELMEIQEIEEKTKKVEQMRERNMCPTKQVRPEKVTKSLREDFNFGGTKEDNVHRDLEKLKGLYQKLGSRMSWQGIGQEKFAKRFLIALLTGGHCLIKGETSVVTTLLPKLAKSLGLTWQRHFCGKQEEKLPDSANLLLVQNSFTQTTLPTLWQAGASVSKFAPWMMIIVENPEDKLDFLLQNSYVFPITIPALKIEQEVAFLQMCMDISRPEKPVTSAQELLSFRLLLEEVTISSQILDYIACVVRFTRPKDPAAPKITQEKVVRGADPAMGAWIIKAARARSALQGKDAVSVKDVQSVAQSLIPARMQLIPVATKTGDTVQSVYNNIMGQVQEPVD